MKGIKKIFPTLCSLKMFFDFIITEIPNILTIISLPILFGLLLFIPKINTYILLGDCVILYTYLRVKSSKYVQPKSINLIWEIGLFATSMLCFALAIIVTEAAKANIKIGITH